MKLANLFRSIGYLASIVSAQTAIVSITSPLSNTKYKAGTEAIISWVNPTVPTISQIVLAKGPPTALQPVMTIANNVDASAMRYSWKIPEDLAPGDDYALELGTSPDIAFTGAFSIEGVVHSPEPSQSTTNDDSSSSGLSTSIILPALPGSTASASSASASSTNASAPKPATNSKTTESAITSGSSAPSSLNSNTPHPDSSASKNIYGGQSVITVGLAAIALMQQLF